MLKRTISGTVYVAIIAIMFLLRQFVHYRYFYIFITFLCGMGTFEMARAFGDILEMTNRTIITVFGWLIVPMFAILEIFVNSKLYIAYTVYGGLTAIILLVIYIRQFLDRKETKECLVSLIPVIYPSLFILSMLGLNVMQDPKGFLALLLLFVVSPCSDILAYLTGMTCNKLTKGKTHKLAPKISPKKTIEGAIGGLIGGFVAGIIVFFCCYEKANPLTAGNNFARFFLYGISGSITTQSGDLFESLIKRKVGIKDMGKIMPGHGGVMDRIDGTLFTSVLYAILFYII